MGKKIKHVQAPFRHQSGQAVVAMLLRLNMAEACIVVGKRSGTSDHNLRDALALGGYRMGTEALKGPVPQDCIVRKRWLLVGPSGRIYERFRWMLRWRGTWYDPAAIESGGVVLTGLQNQFVSYYTIEKVK